MPETKSLKRSMSADEDEFELKQSKKKARIRFNRGDAKAIDRLAVTLSLVDSTWDPLEDDDGEVQADVVDPSAVVDGLDINELQELGRGINGYLSLESNQSNRRYWSSLNTICKHHLERLAPASRHGRDDTAAAARIDGMLRQKDLTGLMTLEKQVSHKLQSESADDPELWEQVLRGIGVYKAKAEVQGTYKSAIDIRLQTFRQEQIEEASASKAKLELLLNNSGSSAVTDQIATLSHDLDAEPELRVRDGDRALGIVEEKDLLSDLDKERRRVVNMGYVPSRHAQSNKQIAMQPSKRPHEKPSTDIKDQINPAARFATFPQDDLSSATKALYEREVARGVQEDEEEFGGEEQVLTKSNAQWSSKYHPRKPRYFNKVQTGYEWNKYNQTHYDHDNPPPKVVQGYKFNIVYADLIDKTRAPTYRIEREGGRKQGQKLAPAGEEDTCIIRFMSGPPYEDVAFRIVDKEWDYSAKQERGFQSTFDKSVLRLHFQFKKVYYRK